MTPALRISPATLPLTRHVIEALEVLGWQPGCPPQITEAIRKIDVRTCRRMRCGQCGQCGLEFRPYHLGTRYRVLAHCPTCQVSEQV
jgi:predicted Zn-ribbon and HTH transcriptional regulator